MTKISQAKRTEKITFSEFKERYGVLTKPAKSSGDTETYESLKQLNEDSTKTINDYHKIMQAKGYMSAEDLSAYKSAVDVYAKTGKRLRQIRADQGYIFDEQNEKDWQNAITTLNNNYDKSYEFYSEYDSLEAFTQAQESINYVAESLAKDTNALQQELDELNAMAEQYLINHQQLDEYLLNPGIQNINEHQAKAIDQYLRTQEWKYGFTDPEGLKKMLTEKTAELAYIKRLQELDDRSAVGDSTRPEYDPEFEEYCTYESTKVSETETGPFDTEAYDFYGSYQSGEANTGYADITYEFINGNPNISELLVGTKYNYSYLNEDEKKLYNYYYRKFGKEASEEYLALLEDALNYRAAKEKFKKFEDHTVLELVFAVEAGLDQFASGLSSLTNWEGEYKATTKTQYLSEMIREDLADDSIPWYNFKTGQWNDEILGSSLGQMTYDTISTTANMAPSLLAAAAVGMVSKTAGAVVGGALMGASAGGNAYQQKLNMGYSQEQAASYGMLVGASEAVLETVLGAAGNIAGQIAKPVLKSLTAIDDVLAVVSKNVGGQILLNAGSEAFEEGLQTILEPFLWETISGEEMSVSRQEILYNSLLGFVSGGLFEGGTVAVNTAVNSDIWGQTGPMSLEEYTLLTQEEALGSDQADPTATASSPMPGVEGDGAIADATTADPSLSSQTNSQSGTAISGENVSTPTTR